MDSKKVREEITNSLVEAIKAGTAPWTRPWRGREAPKNISGHEYSSINTLILTVKGLALDGGIDPRWATFKQISERGLRVKKGAKGTHVTLWKPITESDEQDNWGYDRTNAGIGHILWEMRDKLENAYGITFNCLDWDMMNRWVRELERNGYDVVRVL